MREGAAEAVSGARKPLPAPGAVAAPKTLIVRGNFPLLKAGKWQAAGRVPSAFGTSREAN